MIKPRCLLGVRVDECAAARWVTDRWLLLNHLVNPSEQRGWHCEAERLRGLEIDHQLVFGRRLHRQIGWLLALEDAVDVAGRAPELVDVIRSIRDQAAASDEEAFAIDRGQLEPGHKCDDQLAMSHSQSARRQDQAAIRLAREAQSHQRRAR
jgi:hypothetical protein